MLRRCCETRSSSQRFGHDVSVHVRQATLDAVVVERQPFVVDAEQVQDGRVEVVPRDRPLHRLPADFVR